MSDALVVFIHTQLNEDERVAQEAGGGTWTRGRYDIDDAGNCSLRADEHAGHLRDQDLMVIVYDESSPDDGQFAHIARQDPASTLRRVQAKRRILARHPGATSEDECPGCGAWLDGTWRTGPGHLCPEQCDLAAMYADRPGYDPAWAVSDS